MARFGIICGFCLAAGAAFLGAALAAEQTSDPNLRATIDRLISQLGDERFAAREEAQRELAQLGTEAFDALTLAESHADLEIASRAHYLLGLIDFKWVREDDPPEVRQALGDYDSLDSESRLLRIAKLGEKPGVPETTALCRLVRYEKSHVLSKLAALSIVAARPKPGDEFRQAIQNGIGNSPRPGVDWLRIYVAAQDDLPAAIEKWDEAISTEERVLEQTPERSRPEILAELLKRQVEQFEATEQPEEALATMRRVIQQESGESASLVKLIRWLVDHEAWEALADVEARFVDRFGSDALLTYSLAEALAEAGNEERAEKLATAAFELNPGDGAAHYEVGQQLNERGQLAWAERELRHSIKLGPPESFSAVKSEFLLGDMLHDQGRDADAAEILELCLKSLEKTAAEQGENNNNGIDVRGLLKSVHGMLTARSNYYRSCAAKEKGDRELELKHLELALEGDPLDADVLIGLYRMPNPSEELRTRTEKQIEAAVRQFRTQIAEKPRDASSYNQLAWLLSNTNRNMDEALRCSEESLKLRPDEPGLIDTLARCHFALGQFQSAVKHQRRAVELEPHSGLMRKQLEFFEAELAKREGAESGS